MGTAIPEASRVILQEWQVMGMKFIWDGEVFIKNLGFDDATLDYSIPEQPIPEGMTVDQVRAMWEQGLQIIYKDYRDAEALVSEGFLWRGGFFSGLELLSRMRIPAQPIPEKLLQEPGQEVQYETETEAEFRERTKDAKKITQPTRLRATVESDPNGLDPHAPGAKLDAGKNRLGLVLGGFARALEQVGRAGTGGAVTYSDNGWKEVDDALARYEDAMLRHWVEIKKGNAQDLKTGLLHQAHLVWNALAVLELMLKEPK